MANEQSFVPDPHTRWCIRSRNSGVWVDAVWLGPTEDLPHEYLIEGRKMHSWINEGNGDGCLGCEDLAVKGPPGNANITRVVQVRIFLFDLAERYIMKPEAVARCRSIPDWSDRNPEQNDE